MNFTIKEIYTALLPGFMILLHISIACDIWKYIDNASFHESYCIPLLLFVLTLGCVNNFISSAIDHKCLWCAPKVTLPKDVKEWHQVKDALDKNDKIEGYYTRFAQSRNMCTAMILSLLISCYIVYREASCSYIFLLLIDIILFLVLLLISLPHQRQRYYEVIKAEYEKMKNK